MQIGKYIHAKLTAAAPVTAIVGTGSAARIYPIFLPAGTSGASVVYMVSTRKHGDSKDQAGTHYASTVTLHLWADVSQGAEAYSVLENLADAIYDALSYTEGTAGGVTADLSEYEISDDGRDEQNMYFLKVAKFTLVHRR